MSTTLIAIIGDIEKSDIADGLTGKQFMSLARIVCYREDQFKRDLFKAMQAAMTEEEWSKLTSKLSMAIISP